MASFNSIFRLAVAYIDYRIKAGDEHSVHSPFVFKLITDGIYNKAHTPVFDKIESVRKQLLKDKRIINTIDLGAGSSFDGNQHSRSVRETAAWFAKPSKYCRVLYRIVNHLKPSVMIELGTSLGISAMYQASGNTNGTLYTLEGCEETSKIAVENFRNAGIGNIRSVTGHFDVTLPDLLKQLHEVDYAFIDGNHTYAATIKYFQLLKGRMNENSVIIFDDINWSEGMQKAWREIKADADVTVTIDFFALGLVFFNRGFSKQDFVLKF